MNFSSLGRWSTLSSHGLVSSGLSGTILGDSPASSCKSLLDNLRATTILFLPAKSGWKEGEIRSSFGDLDKSLVRAELEAVHFGNEDGRFGFIFESWLTGCCFELWDWLSRLPSLFFSSLVYSLRSWPSKEGDGGFDELTESLCEAAAMDMTKSL